jgi:hypothetical protein
MSNMVDIEVQDQFGRWVRHRQVHNNPSSIKLALQAALNTQLAAKSKKARAMDSRTGQMIDMAFG